MTTLNKQPSGLLDYLGIKNGGKYPQELATVLNPTWDLERLYLVQSVQITNVVSTVTGAGFTISHGPEENKIWYVFGFGVYVATGVGEAHDGFMGMSRYGAAVLPMSTTQTIGASAVSTFVPQQPLGWIAPGENLGLFTNSVTGTVDVIYTCRFVEMSL